MPENCPEIPQAVQSGLIKVYIQGNQAEPFFQSVQGFREETGLYDDFFGIWQNGKDRLNGGIGMSRLEGLRSIGFF